MAKPLEQVEILTYHWPELAVVNPGCSGYGVENSQLLISVAKRGLTPSLQKLLRRRSPT